MDNWETHTVPITIELLTRTTFPLEGESQKVV